MAKQDDADEVTLQSILFKRNGKWKMAFCRGKEHGCTRNPKHRSSPCELCLIPDEGQTLEQVLSRIEKGDA